MRQEKRTKIITISLFCVAFIIIALTATYAYYQSTIAGTVNGAIAKWSFTANNQTSTMNLDFGELYPGKSGVYNLELSAEDSDLDVYYELYFIEFLDKDILYWDSSYSRLIVSYNPGIYGTIPAGEKITIPIYLNWEYGLRVDSYVEDLDAAAFEIKAQQLTGYSGETPMYFYHDIHQYAQYSDGFIYLGK